MRVSRLDIAAFGPFTNIQLKFPASASDLHLIHGLNEAGKSSLLRAFRALLFGIPTQTRDNFLHENRQLRIAAEITNRHGQSLCFQRRKGNKRTLLDQKGEPLPDDALHPFLGSVNENYFASMFGLGAAELHEGAAELLRGEGDLGNALFSASLGGTSVDRVLRSLEDRANVIYKGRATTNVSIRPNVSQYKALLKTSRESQIRSDAWESAHKELQSCLAGRSRLNSEIHEVRKSLDWLNRCRDAFPSVCQFFDVQRDLEQFQGLPAVTVDFSLRVRESRQQAITARERFKASQQQIENLERRFLDCHVDEAILVAAPQIDRLYQDVKSFSVWSEELAKARSELAQLELDLRSRMRRLELSGEITGLASLAVSLNWELTLREAAQGLLSADEAYAENEARRSEDDSRLSRLKHELVALGEENLTAIRSALAVAADAAESYRTLDAARENRDRLNREVADRHNALLGAPSRWEETESLRLPAKSTIRSFRDRFASLQNGIQKEELAVADGQRRIDSIQGELIRIDRRGTLPSVEKLEAARADRDRGWELILKELQGIGGADELEPGVHLHEAFPAAIRRVDEISDRLRLEAETIAQVEEKKQLIAKSEKLNREAADRIALLRSDWNTTNQEWIDVCAGIGLKNVSPDEVDEWREGWQQFKSSFQQFQIAESQLQTKQAQLQKAVDALSSVVETGVDRSYATLFDLARQRVQIGEQKAGQRTQLKVQITELENELGQRKHREQLLLAAKQNANLVWQEVCSQFGFSNSTTPSRGQELLNEQLALLQSHQTWQRLSSRCAELEGLTRKFQASAAECGAILKLTSADTASQVASFWSGLSAARTASARKLEITAELERARDEAGAAERAQKTAELSLQSLLSAVQVSDSENLEMFLGKLERRDKLDSNKEKLKASILGISRGQAFDSFCEAVRRENADQIELRIDILEKQLEKTIADLSELDERQNQAKTKFGELEKANDHSADCLQQSEFVAAKIKQDALEFVRLRLAIRLLNKQIERFRQENQGPLLHRSGEIFSSVTLGAFSGLEADFNENDEPILVGRRGNGALVQVDDMSAGTRDQLFLALRLAALEKHMMEHEPMPLILDDILITFDDQRSIAVLRELSTLARKTQILIFTHHQHFVQLCRNQFQLDDTNLHSLDSWLS